MTVCFTFADFCQPLALARYRHLFDRSQWLAPEALVDYQGSRLRAIVAHAYAHVPYYRDLFDSLGLGPEDIREVDDLRKLPTLSKATVRRERERLTADDAARFRPTLHWSSGTTGAKHGFLLDRQTNALEFAYYWRYWGWAGYRLGARFAEFSTSYFSRPDRHAQRIAVQRLSGRLLLSSLSFGPRDAIDYARALRAHRARFLKGLPSVLAFFAGFLRDAGQVGPRLDAIFTTGELLLPAQRRLLESCFDAPVFDSYGQMERLVAICECPEHRMHVNGDYGLLETGPDGTCLGTTLHNYSMPLIRYELGDVIEPEVSGHRCPCGRGFPTVRALAGRTSQSFDTVDGRVVPTLFLALREVDGIVAAQIEQLRADTITLKVVPGPELTTAAAERLLTTVRWHVGPETTVALERVSAEDLATTPSGKLAPVVVRGPAHA